MMCASLESIFGMKSHTWVALPSSVWINSSLKTYVCRHRQINNQNSMSSKPKVYWLVMFSILIWLLKSLRKKCRYPSLNLWNPSPKSLNKKGIRVERDQGDVSCVNLCQGVNQGGGNGTHSSFYVTLLVNDLVFATHGIFRTAYLLGLFK